MSDLLTVLDMAKLLQISRSKAYALTKENGFPAIKIGKSIRIIKKRTLQVVAYLTNSLYNICRT